jgi:hypothetical protein
VGVAVTMEHGAEHRRKKREHATHGTLQDMGCWLAAPTVTAHEEEEDDDEGEARRIEGKKESTRATNARAQRLN